MHKIDYDALANVRMNSGTMRGAAAFAGLQGVRLAEAVRAVMEDLLPSQRYFAHVDVGSRTLRLLEIREIYNRPDFPKG